MSQVKITIPVLVLFAVAACLSFPAHAEREVGKISTWELCTNLQDDSSASSALRGQSATELETRNADCSFLDSGANTQPQQQRNSPPGKSQFNRVSKGSARGGGPVGGGH